MKRLLTALIVGFASGLCAGVLDAQGVKTEAPPKTAKSDKTQEDKSAGNKSEKSEKSAKSAEKKSAEKSGEKSPGKEVSGKTAGLPFQASEAVTRSVCEKVTPTLVGFQCLVPSQANTGYIGTGVIISADGLVLTNVTVVPDKATQIRAFLKGGKTCEAELIAVDEKTEASLIRLKDVKDLKPIEIADSKKVQIGDRAYSLGNPLFSLQNDDQVAASRGIISGIYTMKNANDRKIPATGKLETDYNNLAFETDVAVNSGTDGGPLIDANGRLIGIFTLSFERERKMGMAIPIHLMLEAMKDRIKTPKIFDPAGSSDLEMKALIEGAKKRAPSLILLRVTRDKEQIELQVEQAIKQNRVLNPRERMIMDNLRPNLPCCGVVVDSKGYILTANFNLEGTVKQVQALLEDGSAVDAKVIARDRLRDLALLKVEKELPNPITFGKEPDVKLGAFVAVLGRHENGGPFTMTEGILSAIDRAPGIKDVLLYQTDALINYGNQGGVAIDVSGRLLGMVAFLNPMAPWGQNSGIGLIVGSEDIAKSLETLMKGQDVGAPQTSQIGVVFRVMQIQTRADIETFGVVVEKVVANSPAEKAGIKPLDVVTGVNYLPIGDTSDLVRMVAITPPGEKIPITVRRGEKTIEIEVVQGP